MVRGGTSDAYSRVLGPDDAYEADADADSALEVDDGGGGLDDLDPHDTFRAEQTGRHRTVVGTWDGVVTAYELQVTAAD